MSQLTVFKASNPEQVERQTSDVLEIANILNKVNVRFEQWQAHAVLNDSLNQDEVLEAYKTDIARLMKEGGYITVDVISLQPDHPDKDALRQKFLSEHTHSEDEVRFFVKGGGLFTLHIEDNVYAVKTRAGDLIDVPANTPHWFDMGEAPEFTCIRLFNNPEGWVANYTGSDIADNFPRYT